MRLTTEQRIKKAHISMMRHPETALYSGVFMLGESSVVDENITAYTDGRNKKYGRKFLDAICKTPQEDAGIVLHENLHIVFRHLIHNYDLFKENRKLANMAADYVVNDVIMNIKDKTLVTLPAGALYDPKYHNMNMREIYRLLKEECDGDDGGGGGEGDKSQGQSNNGSGTLNDNSSGDDYTFDEHDYEASLSGDTDDVKKLDNEIDKALREGALLAGRLGANIPRAIGELLNPVVDWKREFADFVSSTTKGKDEYTWRKFNRRLLPNDIYMPTVENETIGELVIAIDTSGSIGQQQIDEFATELTSICQSVEPEAVRVLWWDTKVHGEQKFSPDNYDGLARMLKPQGGGGTRVSCVSEYLNKHKVEAECCVVFTDGYVENNPAWNISSPTMWLVTENRGWQPPTGRKVFVNQ